MIMFQKNKTAVKEPDKKFILKLRSQNIGITSMDWLKAFRGALITASCGWHGIELVTRVSLTVAV